MKEKLTAAQAAAKGYRLRSYVGKMVNLRDEGNVYGEKIASEQLDELLAELVETEFVRHSILEGARAGPVSCKNLADRIGIDPARVLREIVVLRRKNLLDVANIEGATPLYRTAGAAES
jgi:hypothetical protein